MGSRGPREFASGNASLCEVTRRGPAPGVADYLIELPHGATSRIHFDAVRSRLSGTYPEDLEQFFFVNTDVGSPECALAIADGLARCGASVEILRCLVPRTFIDCNRLVGAEAPGSEMTPGVPEYVRGGPDVAYLMRIHEEYQAVARQAYDTVCRAGGLALTLHTYAPRSVDIARVDADIVRALRAAYEPGRFERWPLRPAVDIISEDIAGRRLAPAGAIDALRREYAASGIEAVLNATYRLHPETMGYLHSVTHPERVLCVEIRRDLLADPFTPFAESPIGPAKVERMTAPIVRALSAGGPS